jgi:hypothetical protein
MEMVASVLLAAVLFAGAAGKAIAPRSRFDFAVFGIRGENAQWAAWIGAISLELAVATLLLIGFDAALLAAAVLFGFFAFILWRSIRSGASGQACGCFGNRGVVSWAGVLRNALLALISAGAFVATQADLSDRGLAIAGFALLALAIVGLAAAVLALTRELAILRLALQSGGALEIPDEGPPVGTTVAVGRWFETADADMLLAVFVSEGCPMCRNLGPSLAFIDRDPLLSVLTFDEVADSDAWTAFDAPGAPYAVALGADGVVFAKGVANSLPQLESVIATAVRRRAESAHA